MLPQGDVIESRWVVWSAAPLICKLMQVFINLDTMIGRDCEANLGM
jgi:hypothetical protein